jgi:hypothetical protein
MSCNIHFVVYKDDMMKGSGWKKSLKYRRKLKAFLTAMIILPVNTEFYPEQNKFNLQPLILILLEFNLLFYDVKKGVDYF